MNITNLLSIIQISNNNSQLLPYLSEITSEDKQLLQKTVSKVRPNSKNYEDSWGYIIQATRYGGFKWYDSLTGALIFFGKKSEHESTLVVPSAFAEPEYLTYVVDRVQKTLNVSQTILKNVIQEDVSTLIENGFREYNDNEKWNEQARFDDQTYPQLIIDLKKVKHHDGKIYQTLRTTLNKQPHFRIRKYTESDFEAVTNIFDLIDKKYQGSKANINRTYYISHIMYTTADINKYVILDGKTNEIIGFTATSTISPASSALVASLFRPDKRDASIWGIYQTLVKMYDEGYYLANLGGCETKGTHNFMRRTFRPVEQLGRSHLIYEK